MSDQPNFARKWLFSILAFGIAFALSSLIITLARSGKLGSTFPWPSLGYWGLLFAAGSLSILVLGQVFKWIFPQEEEFKPIPSLSLESTPPQFQTAMGETPTSSEFSETEGTDEISPFGQQQKVAS